ncbi:MAG: DUF2490 domain-containing protein [Sediminibacterium sp.]|jgi:hypothetical protein|nr:DUF2490 domain-containing protein [Sediminibacterium sp.]
MLRLKRTILLLGFMGVIQIAAIGQSNNVGTWFVYFGNQKINDKWNIQSDFQYRDYRFLGQRNQFLARAGLGYNLKPQNHNLLLGYAYIATDAYDEFDNNTSTKIEHRIYQQYLYKNNVGLNALIHRFRLEERFSPNEFGLRARYFISLQKPLGSKNIAKGSTYLSAYNELFVDINDPKFDRNRLYGGLGYGITESLRIETGYMIQAQKNITRGQLQLILVNNLPFK